MRVRQGVAWSVCCSWYFFTRYVWVVFHVLTYGAPLVCRVSNAKSCVLNDSWWSFLSVLNFSSPVFLHLCTAAAAELVTLATASDVTGRSSYVAECPDQKVKGKGSPYSITERRDPELNSGFLTVSLQAMWVINPAVVGCHYIPLGLQLPLQPLRGLLPRSKGRPIGTWFWTLVVITAACRWYHGRLARYDFPLVFGGDLGSRLNLSSYKPQSQKIPTSRAKLSC